MSIERRHCGATYCHIPRPSGTRPVIRVRMTRHEACPPRLSARPNMHARRADVCCDRTRPCAAIRGRTRTRGHCTARHAARSFAGCTTCGATCGRCMELRTRRRQQRATCRAARASPDVTPGIPSLEGFPQPHFTPLHSPAFSTNNQWISSY